MLQVPQVKHVVDGIEALSRGEITVPDFQKTIATIPQKALGGYVGPPTTTYTASIDNGTSNQSSTTDSRELMLMLRQMNTLLSTMKNSGVPAYIGDSTIVDFNKRNDFIGTIQTDADS